MTESGHRHRPKPRAWYRTAWFTWAVVILFAVVAVAILVYPVAAMDSVDYCTSCKVMEPAAKTWSQSSHNDVTCTECHVPPGIAPATRWRVKEARNVWADYLGMSVTSDEGHLPKNENCLQCHPLSEIPSETSGLRMNHAQHLAVRGLYCADCHDTVSHKKPGEAQGVRMLTCSMCHNEQGAPDGCDFCHATPTSSDHAPDFMKDHGTEARLNEAECLRCHHDRKSFCDECHSAPPASHYSGKWRYSHDAAAVADLENCVACHDDAFCAQCHSVNHPSGWQDVHGGIAEKGPSACLVCHPQGMCDACHEENGVTQ